MRTCEEAGENMKMRLSKTAERQKMGSQLVTQFKPLFPAHSACFNVLRHKLPYFNVSRQKVLYFNVSRQNRYVFNCFATKQC